MVKVMKNDISNLHDKSAHNSQEHNLVNVATQNTELALEVCVENDNLKKKCEMLEKEVEEYKKKEKEWLGK